MVKCKDWTENKLNIRKMSKKKPVRENLWWIISLSDRGKMMVTI